MLPSVKEDDGIIHSTLRSLLDCVCKPDLQVLEADFLLADDQIQGKRRDSPHSWI